MLKNNKNLLSIFLSISILLYACGGPNENGANTMSKAIDSSTKGAVDNVEPTIHFFVENSGSMYGFVNQGNKFTSIITTYVTDLSTKFKDSVKLYYLNNKIIPLSYTSKQFTHQLNTQSFRKMGGNPSETHIDALLNKIISKADEDNIVIMVTDGIFSPGRADADRFIDGQYNNIKRNIYNHLNSYPNMGIIIHQLSSPFKGTFYNKYNQAFHNTNMVIPFYIWIIGNKENLEKVKTVVLKESISSKNVIENTFSITKGNQATNFAVKKNSGNFELDKNDPKHTIRKLKPDKRTRNNSVKFSVNADLSKFLLDKSYLLDKNNYELNNSNYQLEVKKATSNPFGYTQELVFESDKVYKGEVRVKLKTKLPEWFNDLNDDEGSSPIERKTYGIKYQAHGIYDAFTHTNNFYTEIIINIK